MTRPAPISYAFTASAIGLGGVIRQGKRTTVIPTVASVCLATAGGEASNRVDYYDRDGISFTRAETRVAGYASNNRTTYSTYAESILLNLKIFERISIARMQAIVLSRRELVDGDLLRELEPDQTRFWVKINYHGVEIDGEEVDPEAVPDLCPDDKDGMRYDLLTRRLKEHKDHLQLPEETLKIIAAREADKKNWPALSTPLVVFNGNSSKALAKKSNGVAVDDFGDARFGDAVIKPDRQRLTLLRLLLDADWKPQKDKKGGGRRRVVGGSILADHESGHDGTSSGSGDGSGGSVSSGDSGSNGVPIYP